MKELSVEKIPLASLGIARLGLTFRKASINHLKPKRRYQMVASRPLVPSAKRVGAEFFEFGSSEDSKLVVCRKNSKTAAEKVGGQTLRSQLGCGSRLPEAATEEDQRRTV